MNELQTFSDWSFQSVMNDFHEIENRLSNYISYDLTTDNNDFKNFMYYFINQITILHEFQFVSLWNEEQESDNNYENELYSINEVLKELKKMDQENVIDMFRKFKNLNCLTI